MSIIIHGICFLMDKSAYYEHIKHLIERVFIAIVHDSNLTYSPMMLLGKPPIIVLHEEYLIILLKK